MQKDLTLESLDKSLEQSKRAELEKQQQIELESMNEFQESLRTSFQTELDLIKEDIYKTQKFLNAKNKGLATNAEKYSKEMIESFQSVSQELIKMKSKQWIIPTVMGLAIVLALALGSYLLAQYTSSELQALNDIEKQIQELKKTKDKYVVKIWSDGVGLENEPRKFYDKEQGLWIVQFKGND
jgi:type II secretory pathway pseudopilin PulG